MWGVVSLRGDLLSSSWLLSLPELAPEEDGPLQESVEAAREVNIFSLSLY